MTLNCFDPDCNEPADEKALDEKVGCFVAFCDDHVKKWQSKEHIDFNPYTEQ